MRSNLPSVPDRMKKFPLYKGMFPIHFTVFVGTDGVPEFKVVARARQIEAIKGNLCHLCGDALETPIYFIGGPQCIQHRHFIDGPMHKECAHYAAAACPFLSNPQARYSEVKNATKKEHIEHNQQAAGGLRPARMCIAATKSYTVRSVDKQYPEFIAGPWVELDWTTIPQRVESPNDKPSKPLTSWLTPNV